MSTHYDLFPTLEERVRASRLIVAGRVQSVTPLPRTTIGEVEEEQAIAHIAVDKVLLGELASRELDVRFVMSREDIRRTSSQPFSEKQRLVLMLVPDVGRDTSPNRYVAYLRGAFPLTPNDAFMMETAPEASKSRSHKVRLTLNTLRDVLKTFAAEKAAETRAWAKIEPQLTKQPVLAAITEVPHIGHGTTPTSTQPIATTVPRPANKKRSYKHSKGPRS